MSSTRSFVTSNERKNHKMCIRRIRKVKPAECGRTAEQHQIIGHMIAVAVLYEISYLGEAELELYCSSLMLIVVIEFFQANV